MKILVYKQEELFKELFDSKKCDFRIKHHVSDSGNHIFNGFHYFSTMNLSESFSCEPPTFIVSKNDNNEIIGVLKYGLYDKGNKWEHIGINYVDVAEEYQNKGIATKLLKKMDNIIPKESMIISSFIDNKKLEKQIVKMLKDVFKERKEKFIIR